MNITVNILVEAFNRMEENEVRILLLCYHYSMTVKEISKLIGKEQVEIGTWRDLAIQKLMYESGCKDLNKMKILLKNIDLNQLKFFERGNLFGNRIDI